MSGNALVHIILTFNSTSRDCRFRPARTRLHSPRPQSLTVACSLYREYHGAVTHRSQPYRRGRFPRPSARVDFSVHHRDVERFSYYGMRALLVLYMVKYLLLPAVMMYRNRHPARRARKHIRPARRATLRIADLWSLYRVCLSDPSLEAGLRTTCSVSAAP